MLYSHLPSLCPAAEEGLPSPPAKNRSWIPLNPQFAPQQSLALHLPFSVCHQRHAELQLLFLALASFPFSREILALPFIWFMCGSHTQCPMRPERHGRHRSSRAGDALPLLSIRQLCLAKVTIN